MDDRMLLATFTRDNALGLTKTLQKIADFFPEVHKDLVFIFENKQDHKLVLTYDVQRNTKTRLNEVGATLQLHRKKQFNCLFTLNALNKLLENEGTEKENLDWGKYKNCLLLMDNGELKIIPISFRGVEKLKFYRNQEQIN